MIIQNSKNFLSSIISALDLKSAQLVQDKDRFYLLIVNYENKQKEVHFGEADSVKTSEEIINEIVSGVKSQGW